MEEIKEEKFPVNSIRICFENYDTNVCEGKICGVSLKEEVHFRNLVELIVKIDENFNEIGQPQPFQVLRSFGEDAGYVPYNKNPLCYHSGEEIEAQKGKKTLDLLMSSRHRTEWQGVIRVPGGKNVGHFNSSLECMRLFERYLKK